MKKMLISCSFSALGQFVNNKAMPNNHVLDLMMHFKTLFLRLESFALQLELELEEIFL